MNFINTNIIHNGLPNSNFSMVGTPYGFLIQVDGYKYLFDPVTKTKIIVNNIPFSLAKVEGLPTFANYNDSYLFLLEETTRKIYSTFFLANDGSKKPFNDLVFTVIEPPIDGLRVASFTAFNASVSDHAYDNTGLSILYESDDINKYLSLNDKYPNFLNTTHMKAPMDYTFNFIEGALYSETENYVNKTLVVPPDIMYNPTNKYLNNVPLSYILYDITEKTPFGKIETFIQDTTSSYNDSNYTANTYSDIAFSLGVGKILLLKNNGEVLYSSFLENKINSWRLGGSETPIKVKGVKYRNEVIIHLTVQSGNNFVYKFNPSEDVNPILLFRLNTGINEDLSDKITYSRYFSHTNNNYVNYMAVLTINNGNVEIRTTESIGTSVIVQSADSDEVSYTYFDDHLYIKDIRVDMSSNRTFTMTPNLAAHPTLNSNNTLKANILEVLFKNITNLAATNYINKNNATEFLFINSRSLPPTTEAEDVKVSTSYITKLKGNTTSSELQLEVYDESAPTEISINTGITLVLSSFSPVASSMIHISGSDFFYGDVDTTFEYSLLIKDTNEIINKIAEIANNRNINIKLSYYDAATGTTKEWGLANVQISETN